MLFAAVWLAACGDSRGDLPEQPACDPQERALAVKRGCSDTLEKAWGDRESPRYDAAVCCARVYIDAGFYDGLLFMAETVLKKPYLLARDPSTVVVDDDTLVLAYAWYEAAAQRGLARGYLGMAEVELLRSKPADVGQARAALSLLREADRRGSGAAALSLGTALVWHGSERDRREGIGALRRAVQRRTPGAKFALASALLDSDDPASIEEGVLLLRQAAAFGEPYAAEMLGVLFHEGRGVPKNDQVALEWLERAFKDRSEEELKFPPDAPDFLRQAVEIYHSLRKRPSTAPGPGAVPPPGDVP